MSELVDAYEVWRRRTGQATLVSTAKGLTHGAADKQSRRLCAYTGSAVYFVSRMANVAGVPADSDYGMMAATKIEDGE